MDFTTQKIYILEYSFEIIAQRGVSWILLRKKIYILEYPFESIA